MRKLLIIVCAYFLFIAGSGAQVIYYQDFETVTIIGLPVGWTQTVATGTYNDSVGWNSGAASILNSAGFTPSEHTRFVAVNDDKHEHADNSNSLLISPVINLVGVPFPYLYFDCSFIQSSYGGATEQATVEVSTDTGRTWTIVATMSGNTSGWWESRYVSLLAFAGRPSVTLGFRYKDHAGWELGWGIDNVTVYTPPATDLAITAISPNTSFPGNYGAPGNRTNFSGTFFNGGRNSITGFDIVYKQGSNAPVVATVSGIVIPPFTYYNFTDTAAYTFPATPGNYPFSVWVNASGDANSSNDTITTSLNTVLFMPAKRLLVEEVTSTLCGECVRGIIYRDSLYKQDSNKVSIVSVHDKGIPVYDPMAIENGVVQDYNNYLHSIAGFNGLPGVFIDRNYFCDPAALLTNFNKIKNYFGFADLTMDASLDGENKINVVTTLHAAIDMFGDYRVELVITEDNVHNSGSAYSQHNSYSYQDLNLPLAGVGYNFQDSNALIPGSSMNYQFVARSVLPNPSTSAGGILACLPASLYADSFYYYAFAPVIKDSTWQLANLRATVLFIDNNPTNITYMQVLNSLQARVHMTTGVNELKNAEGSLNIYPNPANEQATVQFNLPVSGNIGLRVIDALGREVIAISEDNRNRGLQQMQILTGNLPSGIYTIQLTTQAGVSNGSMNIMR